MARPIILLLLSFLIIASASEHYDKNGKQELDLHTNLVYKKPNINEQNPEEKEKLNNIIPETIGYKQPKPEEKEKPFSTTPKSEEKEKFITPKKIDHEKPDDQEYRSELVSTEQIHGGPKPNNELPRHVIGVQGLVYCKSGLKYSPLLGAVTRITCVVVNEKSYKTTQYSVLSKPCDSKGNFYATISPESVYGRQWKIKDCKAYLDHSPLKSCKVPTNVNNGISGDLLASNYDILANHNSIKLSSVGPFFYTSVDQPYNEPVGP